MPQPMTTKEQLYDLATRGSLLALVSEIGSNALIGDFDFRKPRAQTLDGAAALVESLNCKP